MQWWTTIWSMPFQASKRCSILETNWCTSQVTDFKCSCSLLRRQPSQNHSWQRRVLKEFWAEAINCTPQDVVNHQILFGQFAFAGMKQIKLEHRDRKPYEWKSFKFSKQVLASKNGAYPFYSSIGDAKTWLQIWNPFWLQKHCRFVSFLRGTGKLFVSSVRSKEVSQLDAQVWQ